MRYVIISEEDWEELRSSVMHMPNYETTVIDLVDVPYQNNKSSWRTLRLGRAIVGGQNKKLRERLKELEDSLYFTSGVRSSPEAGQAMHANPNDSKHPARILAPFAVYTTRPARGGHTWYLCGYPGCPFKTVDEFYAQQHIIKPHKKCTCEKWFLHLSQHRAAVVRRGIQHPPFAAAGGVGAHDPRDGLKGQYVTEGDVLEWTGGKHDEAGETKKDS